MLKKERRNVLSLKQKRFCEEYAISGNATDAAKKAGYSEKTARTIGAENLTKPDIQKYLAELTKPSENKKIATAEEVLQFWAQVMRDGEVPVKDRLRASENLGKRYRLMEPETDEKSDREALKELCEAIKEVSCRE